MKLGKKANSRQPPLIGLVSGITTPEPPDEIEDDFESPKIPKMQESSIKAWGTNM